MDNEHLVVTIVAIVAVVGIVALVLAAGRANAPAVMMSGTPVISGTQVTGTGAPDTTANQAAAPTAGATGAATCWHTMIHIEQCGGSGNNACYVHCGQNTWWCASSCGN